MSGRHPHASHAQGHTHGLVDHSVLRSRAGVRAVLVSLLLLGATAAAQAAVYVLTGSVALLADLIHNAGDALTAVPVGAAFLLRSARAEQWAGYVVVLAIFVSACVALWQAVERLLHPQELEYLLAARRCRCARLYRKRARRPGTARAGRRLESAALVADGHHARVDGFVSLGVVLSAILVALGATRADPIVGLAITLVILRITWQAWRTIRAGKP